MSGRKSSRRPLPKRPVHDVETSRSGGGRLQARVHYRWDTPRSRNVPNTPKKCPALAGSSMVLAARSSNSGRRGASCGAATAGLRRSADRDHVCCGHASESTNPTTRQARQLSVMTLRRSKSRHHRASTPTPPPPHAYPSRPPGVHRYPGVKRDGSSIGGLRPAEKRQSDALSAQPASRTALRRRCTKPKAKQNPRQCPRSEGKRGPPPFERARTGRRGAAAERPPEPRLRC